MSVVCILNYSRCSIVGLVTLPVSWVAVVTFFVSHICYFNIFGKTLYFENKNLYSDFSLECEGYLTEKF